MNIELVRYDRLTNYIREKCEHIIFSFHNCPDNIYNSSKDILESIFSKDKLILLRFNNISYLQCYKNIERKVTQLKCTDILQIQDDQFGLNSKDNIENLKDLDDILDVYKINYNIEFLHLYDNEGKPKDNLVPIETIKTNNCEVYKYDSRDFKKCNLFSWNDGTYIISLKFLNYLLHIKSLPTDVWNMEIF